MRVDAIVAELEACAEKLNVKVSYEGLGASVGVGGLCRVKGQYRIIIDKRTSPEDRAGALAEALAQLDTTNLFLAPATRQFLQRHTRARAS